VASDARMKLIGETKMFSLHEGQDLKTGATVDEEREKG